MVRSGLGVAVAVLLAAFAGCGDGAFTDDGIGFPGGGTGGTDCSEVEIPGCDEVVSDCGAGACKCVCADDGTAGGVTDDGAMDTASETAAVDTGTGTGTSMGTGAGTETGGTGTETGGTGTQTGGTDTDTGGTSSSPLGDCVSVDVWDSCAAYCVAVMASCSASGCDGGTVHYYNSGADCDQQVDAEVSDQACDAPLETSGGVSFARCCCQ